MPAPAPEVIIAPAPAPVPEPVVTMPDPAPITPVPSPEVIIAPAPEPVASMPPPAPTPEPEVIMPSPPPAPVPVPTPEVVVVPAPAPAPVPEPEVAMPSPPPAEVPDESVGEVVCDPFAKANVVDPIMGLRGKLWSLANPSNSSQVKKSTDFLKLGEIVTENLFLSKVEVPTRAFSQGFVGADGDLLKNGKGETLIEWFGIELNSSVVLTSIDKPGRYQFAVLADDGVSVEIKDKDRDVYSLISNEGLHPTKLGCSAVEIELNHQVALPIKISYFQGPRYHISLSLLWRFIPEGEKAINDKLCGYQSNEFYNRPASGASKFDELKSRGWNVLDAGNFMLETGYNKCVKATASKK